MAKIGVYPGSFDPITQGHLDIIKRASKFCDKLIVAVLKNSRKSPIFTEQERVELIRRSVTGIDNLEIESFDGLLADYVKKKDAQIIIRGLRAMSDFEYEFQMALTNKKLNPEAETVFLTTDINYMYLSSSIVRDVAKNGGDISEFVPAEIKETVENKLRNI